MKNLIGGDPFSTLVDYFNSGDVWKEATSLIGKLGVASTDAMILNIFLCSKIPILLTVLEMTEYAIRKQRNKEIFVPDSVL